MALNVIENLAHRSNYGSERPLSTISYIVIHYTGNDGDRAFNNTKYFQNPLPSDKKASAHYFVDDNNIYRSVPDKYVAYSVGSRTVDRSKGGGKYYGLCTNSNSLNIELCDTVKDGKYNVTQKTIDLALELTKELKVKYGIPESHIIRHFDVTGKECPAYWVDKTKWEKEFHSKIYILNGWYQDGDTWYYYEDGKMSHGKWIKDGTKYYYLKPDGSMAVDEFVKASDYETSKKLYWVNIEGMWDEKTYRWKQDETGWWIAQVGGAWYPKSEWYKIDGKWYYFNEKGYMVTGTKTIDGRIYSFNSDGELVG